MNWEHAIVVRPAEHETVSGDAAAVFEDGERLVCAVVDGLGHGPAAAEASTAFLECMASNLDLPLPHLMMACDKAITSTRGAAASLMAFDAAARTFEYVGVGNCHLHVLGSERIKPVSAPGIVGHRIRKLVPLSTSLPEDCGLYLLCSDGIGSRVHPELYAGLSAAEAAESLLEHHGKAHDDATVLAVRLFCG